jgi:murein DD-endopeptidase MepM/ murein hydrolase activator NlpD
MKKYLNIVIVFILLFCHSYIFVFAENDENLSTLENTLEQEDNIEEENRAEQEIENLKNKKSELEDSISEKEAQIGVVEGTLSKTLEEIEVLSTKIEEKKNEISALETQEISLMNFINVEEKKLEEYSERYEKEKKLLEKRLVVMYEMGETKFLDVLLKSRGISDFLSKYYLLSEIGKADSKLVKNVKNDKEQTEAITQALKEKKEELEKDKQDKEKYEISLSNMEILKNNKVANLNEEENKLYAQIEEYRNHISDIEQEIKRIALQNLGKVYIGGNFVWPTPGYTTITSPFGMRTHPITGIYKLHTGVDIGAPYGSNFIASNDGVVVKADYNFAYGNMVMIDHGGGVMTLYAHGSEILVNEGDEVKQGQAILKVGSTGYSTGPHAHFEIRINGEYLNPLDYVSPDNGKTDLDIEKVTIDLNN